MNCLKVFYSILQYFTTFLTNNLPVNEEEKGGLDVSVFFEVRETASLIAQRGFKKVYHFTRFVLIFCL